MVDQKLVKFIELVEQAANARNEMPIPRWCIEEALRRIVDGREEVSYWYPSGFPSLKGVYDVAVKLESAEATKN